MCHPHDPWKITVWGCWFGTGNKESKTVTLGPSEALTPLMKLDVICEVDSRM